MPSNSSGPAVKVSRPTFNIGGKDEATLSAGLIELLIVETTQGLYRCEATFGNWGPKNGSTDFIYFDRRMLDFGKTFQVKIGTNTIFDGRVTALEAQFPEGAPPQICVLAEDRFQDLRMTRRTRSFSNVSDSAVFNQIATDHGLTANVSVGGPTYPHLAQVNQSDLAFLRERARTIDAELWMDGKNLNVKSHTQRTGAPTKLNYGKDLREFFVLADLANQRTAVNANGWDVVGKAALTFQATDSVLGSELNGDTSGASILQQAFGARKEALAHTVPLNSQEAQSAAETYFKVSARRFLTARGTAETDGKFRAGVSVDLQGLGPLFSGKYYVCEIKHLFDGMMGLRTEFRAERPGIGAP